MELDNLVKKAQVAFLSSTPFTFHNILQRVPFPWQVETDRSLTLSLSTHLHVAGQGEVLPEWVPLESVVCEDSAQVGVVGEEDAVHVPDLPLIPVDTDTRPSTASRHLAANERLEDVAF